MKLNSKIEFIAGSKDKTIFSTLPLPIYDLGVIEFLSELSKSLLGNSKTDKTLRVFCYFAFWCRKSNLLRLRKLRKDLPNRYGRGLSFHIAPSNVVTNILFTLAFGLLSGCPSLIRVSKKNINQFSRVSEIIDEILDLPDFKKLKKYISIITYDHDDEINGQLSQISDLRIIWGGDDTIRFFKKFITKPKSIDIVFPNRNSLAIFSGKFLIEKNNQEINYIAKSFANDIGLFSQRACSSPKKIIIFDKEADLNKIQNSFNYFLKICDSYIGNLDDLEPYHTLDNFKKASEISAYCKDSFSTFKGRNLFAIYMVDKSTYDFEMSSSFANSCLAIYRISNLDEVSELLPKDNQTIVQIGLSNNEIIKLKNISAPLGTDRIVKAGQALNMDIFWDGYDIVGLMSRIVVSCE